MLCFGAFVLLAALIAAAQTQPHSAATPLRAARWRPPLNLRAQFQLQGIPGSFCTTGGYHTNVRNHAFNGNIVSPDLYAIDLYADDGACPNYAPGIPNRDAVAAIHAQGKKAVCYVDIGSAEPYRPDYQKFVEFDKNCSGCLLGKTYDSGDPFKSNTFLNLKMSVPRSHLLIASILNSKTRACTITHGLHADRVSVSEAKALDTFCATLLGGA
jgi:hypothetical protein